MGRKTQQNDITSKELLDKINPKNKRLMSDFLIYLKSIQRSINTVETYTNDLEIFFVWCLQNADNKFFVDINKRDIISYQNYLIYINNNSPARVRRLKSTLSSLSNYIENILDDEFSDFRNIVKKVENPVNQPTREKTVFEMEDLQPLLDHLVERKQFLKACVLAAGIFSGRRKSELTRLKVDYFKDENIIYGSLYKTPEKVKTKGRGLGEYLHIYLLAKEFKPYLELWMEQRKQLGIDSEWLFVTKNKNGKWEQLKSDTMNSWAITFSNYLHKDFYFHSLRHMFVTQLSKQSLPDSVIQSIIGWKSSEMLKVYKDVSVDDEIGQYFDENGIKEVKAKSLSDL